MAMMRRSSRVFLNKDMEDGMLSSAGFTFNGDIDKEDKYASYTAHIEMKACGSGHVCFDFNGKAKPSDIRKSLAKLARMQKILAGLEATLVEYQERLRRG